MTVEEELIHSLREMVEHFATRPEFRTAESYQRSNTQVAADARALLARLSGSAAPPGTADGVNQQDTQD